MFVALILAAALQDPVDWPAIARDHEWHGRFDRAIIALCRSLQDVDDEQVRRELSRLTEWDRALRFTLRPPAPDGADIWASPEFDVRAGKIVTAWRDLRVWSEDDGSLLREPIELPAEAVEVFLDPTGKRAAVTSEPDLTVTVYDLATGGILLDSIAGGGWRVVWGPRGERIAATALDEDGNQRVSVWDVSTGQRILATSARGDWIRGLCFSPDGNLLACGGSDVSIHDLRTGETIATGIGTHDDWLRFHPTEPRLFFHGDYGGRIREWDVESGAWAPQSLCGLGYAGSEGELVCDAVGNRWTVANQSAVVATWRADGRPAGRPLVGDGLENEHLSDFGGVGHELSPDGLTFAAAGLWNTIRVWDTVTGERLGPLLHAAARVVSVRSTRAGSVVASVQDGTVRVWSVDDLAPVRVAAERDNEKIIVPDGASLGLTVRTRGHLEIVEAPDRVVSSAHAPARLDRLAVSSDGTRLAASGMEFGLWTWDLIANDPCPEPLQVTDWECDHAIALDATGEWLATASWDATYVWNAGTGDLVRQISCFEVAWDLAFDADGALWGRDGRGVGRLPGEGEFEGDDEWQALALSQDARSTLWSHEGDDRIEWHTDDEIVESIAQLVPEVVRGEIDDWLTSARCVVALHPLSATIIDPLGGRVIATVELGGPFGGVALGGAALGGAALGGAALDGDRLVVWSGPALRLFDTETGTLLLEHRANGPISAARGIPGTDRVVCTSTTCEIGGIDVRTNERFGPWLELPNEPEALALEVQGGFAIGFASGRVLVLDPASGSRRELVPAGRAGVSILEASPDGSRLAIRDQGDLVTLLDVESGSVLFRRSLLEQARAIGAKRSVSSAVVLFDASGERLLVASSCFVDLDRAPGYADPAWAGIVDAETGALRCTLKGFVGRWIEAKFSNDGERVFAWFTTEAAVWDTTSGERLAVIPRGEYLGPIVFRPDDRSIAVVSEPNWHEGGDQDALTVRVLDGDTGEDIVDPLHLMAEPYQVHLDPDGRYLYLSLRDGPDRWYDLETLEEITGFSAVESFLHGSDGLVLLDGQRLARIDEDGFHRIGVRRWTHGVTRWTYHGRYGGGPALVDDTRILIHARATPDGLEPVVLDFGPSTAEPIAGTPAGLLAEWSLRLGLRTALDGRIVPESRR